MTTNRLATSGKGEASPTDPHMCVIWANARLHPDAVAAGLHWVVTGNPAKPIALVKH